MRRKGNYMRRHLGKAAKEGRISNIVEKIRQKWMIHLLRFKRILTGFYNARKQLLMKNQRDQRLVLK